VSPRVLVAVASRHGGTREIAEAIARELEGAGLTVDVRAPEEVAGLAPYRAVVLGSAVYFGRWLAPARDLAQRLADDPRDPPVWLFSSGPLGDPLRPDADSAVDVSEVLASTRAREHRLFGGRLDRARLGLRERAIARAVHASEGDYRDWPEVRRWAAAVAGEIARQPHPVP